MPRRTWLTAGEPPHLPVAAARAGAAGTREFGALTADLTLVAGNAKVIAADGSHESKRAAEHGIESVKQNAPAARADDQRKPRRRQAMKRVTTS